MAKKKTTHNDRIINYLLQYGKVDDEKALLRCSVKRLSARIHELRFKYLLPIETVRFDHTNKYGEKSRPGYYKVDRKEFKKAVDKMRSA